MREHTTHHDDCGCISAKIAASQAREVALREWLSAAGHAPGCECLLWLASNPLRQSTPCTCGYRALISAPTDTAALRAMLVEAWDKGYAFGEGREDLDTYSARLRDVDRVLGGS